MAGASSKGEKSFITYPKDGRDGWQFCSGFSTRRVPKSW